MNLAKERNIELDLINRRISQAKELKNKIKTISSKLRSDHEKGLLSYWEYQNLLNRQLDGKSEKYWLNYYDSYIEDLSRKIPKESSINNKLIVLSIFLIMGLGLIFFNSFTGFTVKVDDNEAILRNIIFYTLDNKMYVPELLLEQGETSENPINLENYTVYNYLRITNPPDLGRINKIEIEFAIEKSWIESNNFTKDKIVLYEYSNNKWNPTLTQLKNEDNSKYYYKSNVNSINEFVITVIKEKTINIISIKPQAVQKIKIYSFIKENKDLILFGLLPISILISSLILILGFIIKKINKNKKHTKDLIREAYSN